MKMLLWKDTCTPMFLAELFAIARWLRRWRTWLQWGRPGIDPWVGKIPWRRECLPMPVFLLGESHRQGSLVGYSLWGHDWVTNTQDMDVPKCPSTGDVVCNYIVFKVHDYRRNGTWSFEGSLKGTVWMWGNIQNSAEGRCAGWFLCQIQWGKMNSGTCIRFGYTL